MPDQTPSMPPLPEPAAYKVVGGHVYIDSAFCSRDNAERSIERRNDCAVLKPLYTAEQVQAVADERVREALELAAKLAGSTHPAYRDRIGTAIRALARPTLSLE